MVNIIAQHGGPGDVHSENSLAEELHVSLLFLLQIKSH